MDNKFSTKQVCDLLSSVVQYYNITEDSRIDDNFSIIDYIRKNITDDRDVLEHLSTLLSRYNSMYI